MSTRQRLTKVIQAQFNKCIREPDEYLKFAIDEEKPDIVYVLVHNIKGENDEFEGGEFLFRMEFPDKYPHEPPSFYALNENGVYAVEKKVCISIGEYHKDAYRATLGIRGFAQELANGLMCWKDLGHGINILHTTLEHKFATTIASKDMLLKSHPKIMDMLKSQYDVYSTKWPVKTPTEKTPEQTAPPS